VSISSRILSVLLHLLLFFFVVLGFLYLFRTPLLNGPVRLLAARALESGLGLRVSMRGISGSPFSSLCCSSILAFAEDEWTTLRTLHLEGVEARFDLGGLLRGGGLSCIEVRAAYAHAALDLDEGGGPRKGGQDWSAFEPPETFLAVDLPRGTLLGKCHGGSFHAEGLSFRVEPPREGRPQEAALHVRRLRLGHAHAPWEDARLSAAYGEQALSCDPAPPIDGSDFFFRALLRPVRRPEPRIEFSLRAGASGIMKLSAEIGRASCRERV